MYELFVIHQRKFAVARELHRRGHRTRNGSEFTATTIDRLIRDTTAKGMRRANYTKSAGKDRNWSVKPESDWIHVPCDAIVSEELWTQCNAILDAQTKRRTSVGKRAVYLLSGFVHCPCGTMMYVYHSSKAYACRKCKTRIAVSDLDEIYQLYLKEYLISINHADYVEQCDSQLQACKTLLEASRKDRERLARRINDLLELRIEGSLSKERYMELYQPLETQLQQLDAELPKLEAEIDVRTISLMSSDTVLTEVRTLHDEWSSLAFEQRRGIVETITTSIEVGQSDITINLAYAPVPRKSEEYLSPPHGFIAASNTKFAGKCAEKFALEINIFRSSKGCLNTSSTHRLNSGSSSKNNTP
ncbi:MAG TPA: recombinase family protein [Mucilaginibacter sp.]